MSDWSYFGLFFLVLILLVGAADLIRRGLGWPVEATRKSVHVITGLLVATTPFLFVSWVPLAVLAVIFIVLNYGGLRFGFFQGMHATERVSYGTVFYPVAFLVLLLWFWRSHPVAIVGAMLVLGVADAVAASVGEHARRPLRFRLALEQKSLQGSAAMFVASFVVLWLTLVAAGPFLGDVLSLGRAALAAALGAILATAAEALSAWGSDNLTAPLAAGLVLDVFLEGGAASQELFGFGVGLAALVAGASYLARFLTAGGATLTFLLGSVIFGLGGWTFAAPILAFFIFSSLLSKLTRRFRGEIVSEFEKSDRRDLAQVLANGGLAAALVLVWYWTGSEAVYFIYLAGLAAVTADTWATELGVLVGWPPRSALSLKPVPVGASGGVTLPGLVAAWLGGTVIGVVGALTCDSRVASDFPWAWVWLVGGVGLVASLVDSLLGATLQAQYVCAVCGKQTERTVHCGTSSKHLRGFGWMNNDVVNGICSLAGAAFGWLVFASIV